jgi:hypothetical protein
VTRRGSVGGVGPVAKRRIRVFGLAALCSLAISLGLDDALASFDTNLRLTAWVWLVPALVVAALVMRPVWSVAFAGVAAGGVLALSNSGIVILSHGYTWSVALLLAEAGLIATLLVIAVQTIRIFPNAVAELRDPARRRARRASPRTGS